MYQQFDWNYCKSKTNPLKFNYLKNYWDKEISEEQFISDWKQFKPLSTLHLIKNKKNAGVSKKLWKSYSTSKLKQTYRNLKNKFGFFIGNNKNNHGE